MDAHSARTRQAEITTETAHGSRASSTNANLRRLCEEHLPGQYRIEVADLLKNPKLARGDRIPAVPTLVRKLPPSLKNIIGDLWNRERVLVGLDLRPRAR